MRLPVLIGLMAWVGFASPVNAQDQKPQHACPVVGAKIKTTTGTESTVTGVSGFTCTLKTNTDRIYYLHAGFVFLGTPFGDAAAPKAERLWPLEVGKKVSYTWTPPGSRSDATVTFEVTGKQRITVPAGEYETYVVVQTVVFVGSYEGVHTLYYSPETATAVKVDFVAVKGTPSTPQPSWEMVSYQKP